MTGLIIGSGSFAENCLEYAAKADIVICADGGYDSAKKYGIKADIVIGDMDSVKGEFSEKHIVFPCEKNETDSEIAIDYALKQGCDRIIMAGFTGTRLDHTLNNIFLLEKIHSHGAWGTIIDEHNEIYYICEEIEITGKKGDFISLIPITDLKGVSNEGMKYPLYNEDLHFGKSRGISNEILNKKCRITVKAGKGIVIKSRD